MPEPPEIDTTKPHSARLYDAFLGGKTHYAPDAAAAEYVKTLWPGVQTAARANRAFMHRVTRYLAGQAGVRQFLDIGTGIPTEPNLHQVAQATAPEARVVYADNDPIVLQYARALLQSTPEGRTAYVHGDISEPRTILDAPELTDTIDLSRPVALSLIALLHYVPNRQRPYEVVRTVLDSLAPGSYLVLSHVTPDHDPETWARLAEMDGYGDSGQGRGRSDVLAFFDGLELVEPGLVPPHRWRPEGPVDPEHTDAAVSMWAGVARVP